MAHLFTRLTYTYFFTFISEMNYFNLKRIRYSTNMNRRLQTEKNRFILILGNGCSNCRMVIMKLSDIFKEGSEARKRFAQFYAVFAIVIIVLVLVLLALATRG